MKTDVNCGHAKTPLRLCLLLLLSFCAAGGWLPSLRAADAGHGVAAANINVFQLDTANTTNSVSVTTSLSINGLAIRDGSNRGDYFVQVGPGSSDDVETGVLLTSVAENGRDNLESSYPGANFCTSAMDYSRSGASAGAYYVSTFNAPTGSEYNINVSAAFFPYSKWVGGYARNSGDTNGGANNLFTGSAGLALGTQFVDNGGGLSTVNLTSLGIDSQSDGVLLVTHGGNEDNYALSQANNNGTWTVYVKDNGTDSSAWEQGPVAFVFIPRTNTTVITGRFRGDGNVLLFSGATPLFNITNVSTGTWRLSIPGQTPASGVLILSPEGGLTVNQDNIVSYQPDGDGWLIQSRDLPGSPPGLQTPTTQPVASFVFIPAAASATLVLPADNAQNLAANPTLSVAVSNTAPGSLTVTFYGREAATPYPGPDFAIVALPDTQYYSAERFGGTKEMFAAQTEWVITNRLSRNIPYVVHLGDISDSGDIKSGVANTTEWRNATNAMYRLDNPVRTLLANGIPYGMAVGNHDQEPNGDPTGTTTLFNRYFGLPHFEGRSYYAGHYGTNNNNHFDFFSAAGLDFVVLYFEYDTGANPNVLAWAGEVLRTNATRRVILVTHYAGSPATPSSFSAQGAAIYNAFKTNTNFFLMLGGHVDGEGSRSDTFNGHTVRTLISDYQFRTNGGNGLMRIMDFSPSNNVVVVQTYSPWTGEYETDADSEFFFSYNMQPGSPGSAGTPYTVLATNTGVSPGSLASCVWPGLQHSKSYEWYVAVTDGLGNTTIGPAWRFSIGPNAAPSVNNQLVTLSGDAPANLALVGSDPNGDPLSFSLSAGPSRGVLLNVDTNQGTFTYLPARGFRGSDRFTFRASDGLASSSVATMNFNVLAPADTNANGLPDAWEAAYGVSDPNADTDGDGLSNLQEYQANTNPTNAASLLKITSATAQTNGFFSLTWPSVGGTRYRVQFSDALAAPTPNFNDIVRPLTNEMGFTPFGTLGTQAFTDDFTLTSAPTNHARYYRLKITQ